MASPYQPSSARPSFQIPNRGTAINPLLSNISSPVSRLPPSPTAFSTVRPFPAQPQPGSFFQQIPRQSIVSQPGVVPMPPSQIVSSRIIQSPQRQMLPMRPTLVPQNLVPLPTASRIIYQAPPPPPPMNTVVVQQIPVMAPPPPPPQPQIILPQKEPQVQTIVKYQRQQQPVIQTTRQSQWENYYNQTKLEPARPILSNIPQQKAFCKPWMWAILGLLALAGLITGIVLASQAAGRGNVVQTKPTNGTAGIPGQSTDTNFIPPSGNGTNQTTINSTVPQKKQPEVIDPLIKPIQGNQTVVPIEVVTNTNSTTGSTTGSTTQPATTSPVTVDAPTPAGETVFYPDVKPIIWNQTAPASSSTTVNTTNTVAPIRAGHNYKLGKTLHKLRTFASNQ